MSPALALPALVPLRIRGALAWILAAGVLAATLDLLYATAFWSLRGVPAQRILQSIAAGLLGRASFDGGVRSAALGALLHYTIAMAMLLFGERLTPVQVAGGALVIVAVLLAESGQLAPRVPAQDAPRGGDPARHDASGADRIVDGRPGRAASPPEAGG